MSYIPYGISGSVAQNSRVIIIDESTGEYLQSKDVVPGQYEFHIGRASQKVTVIALPLAGVSNKNAIVQNNVSTVEMSPITNQVWFTESATLPYTPRTEGICAAYNNKLYYGGGSTSYTDFWEYDLETKVWTQLADLPEAKYGASVGVHGNKLYAIGGFDSASATSSTSLIYDFDAGTWSYGTGYTRNNLGASVLYKGYMYHYAGQWIYALSRIDLAEDFGESLTDGPKRGPGMICAAWNNKIYAFGSVSGTTWHANTTFQIYDIATDTWSYGTYPGFFMYNSFVPYNGYIYRMGQGSFAQYEVDTDSWTTLTAPGVSLQSNSDFGVVCNGAIYYFGNYSSLLAWRI